MFILWSNFNHVNNFRKSDRFSEYEERIDNIDWRLDCIRNLVSVENKKRRFFPALVRSALFSSKTEILKGDI